MSTMRRLAIACLAISLHPGCSDANEGQSDPRAPATPGSAAPESKDAAPELEALSGEARKRVKGFATALKGELIGAMKTGGPTKAIEVCNERAPALATAASADGWTLARRSTRLRNPDNAPDAWERATLERFLERMKAGESVHELERSEVVQIEGRRTFRYAKAIPLGGECLTCHGSELSPEVSAALDARYPDDAARGYAAGDLRGIFSVSKAL